MLTMEICQSLDSSIKGYAEKTKEIKWYRAWALQKDFVTEKMGCAFLTQAAKKQIKRTKQGEWIDITPQANI